MNKYLERFCAKMPELKCDAFLVTNVTNMQYLSGFTGHDSFLLVLPDKSFLITDFRYIKQAQDEIKDKSIRIIRQKDGLFKKALELIHSSRPRIKRLGFEEPAMSITSFRELKKGLKNIKLVPDRGTIENLAAIKTPEEIAKIRVSIKCAIDGFNRTRKTIRPGLSEKNIANELDYNMRALGAERTAFSSIVAVDEQAALPHAPVSDKKVTANCLVLIDWGACVNEYHSDLTRVLFLGKISPLDKKIFQIVRDAQQKAIDMVRPGAVIKDIDAAARNYIKQKGYGKYFGHSLGHGVGRMVHTMPRVSSKNKEALKAGMVFTVEPGIYLPDKTGVRIEDMVLVTENGCEVLTRAMPKEIEDMRV
ncbi:MAG: Xaa-Pro peptidase family protein [Planctomycetota bacterium]